MKWEKKTRLFSLFFLLSLARLRELKSYLLLVYFVFSFVLVLCIIFEHVY